MVRMETLEVCLGAPRERRAPPACLAFGPTTGHNPPCRRGEGEEGRGVAVSGSANGYSVSLHPPANLSYNLQSRTHPRTAGDLLLERGHHVRGDPAPRLLEARAVARMPEDAASAATAVH